MLIGPANAPIEDPVRRMITTMIDGTTIHIEALNLDGTPQEILDEIQTLAKRLEARNLTHRIAS